MTRGTLPGANATSRPPASSTRSASAGLPSRWSSLSRVTPPGRMSSATLSPEGGQGVRGGKDGSVRKGGGKKGRARVAQRAADSMNGTPGWLLHTTLASIHWLGSPTAGCRCGWVGVWGGGGDGGGCTMVGVTAVMQLSCCCGRCTHIYTAVAWPPWAPPCLNPPHPPVLATKAWPPLMRPTTAVAPLSSQPWRV